MLRPGDVLYIPPMWWHEFRTVSDGASLSTTIRVHLLTEDKAFHGLVSSYKQLHTKLLERGSERLMAHITSFLLHGMLLGLPAPHNRYSDMLQHISHQLLDGEVDVQVDTDEVAEVEECAAEEAPHGEDADGPPALTREGFPNGTGHLAS